MTAPNMAAITASLERSLQNFSLNTNNNANDEQEEEEEEDDDRSSGVAGGGGGILGRSSTSDDAATQQILHHRNSDTTLELNSHLSLPYHWEQCLDLKTGEIYYINWRNGMKAKEDPRINGGVFNGEFFYSEDDSSYDSAEESSSESSPCSSRDHLQQQQHYRVEREDSVLVVAGCKGCLMYFMVPKQVEDCPKCNAQLLHFDRSEN
ncbi:uncharacterized protein LOC110809401 [Carica papaya]|uniref:uncharacterized protein LOC110809401 n=1 Tax=Carica papaya TaxID=3649 RepID=UPI000B8C815B|nr:uncharacterized protein LOC110809401 [Carica papaya]